MTSIAVTLPAWASSTLAVALPLLIAVACWLGAGALNWLLWWESHEDWARWAGSNPKKALLVRALRLVGPHLRAIALVWEKYLSDRAKAAGIDGAPPAPPVS